jgi:hypothetical protein
MNGLHTATALNRACFHDWRAVGFGKVGLTAIGNDDEASDETVKARAEVLDLEASMGHAPSGHPWPTATSVG